MNIRPWMSKAQKARHWHKLKNGAVKCKLCPRNCELDHGKFGFCGVRGNDNSSLFTFNYGCSVLATQEYIETEAVYHHSPGSKILAMGNIGCNMSCDYCQNWKTSQVQFLPAEQVAEYTPEQVVSIAEKSGIDIISWTYNDPVVWHEFVMDTAYIAKERGILNLYKSAFYIEASPIEELMEVIDIFSISLKSMSPKFYSKITKGRLEPVLEAIKQIAESNTHLEISQLVVTEQNDSSEDVKRTINWVLDNVGPKVPLHFVAFHPAYKYNQTQRTPIETLLKAKRIAEDAGIEFCYLGNIYENNINDTTCSKCGHVLVRRFGMITEVVGLDEKGRCLACQQESPIISPLRYKKNILAKKDRNKCFEYKWSNEVNSLHVEVDKESQLRDFQITIIRYPKIEPEIITVKSGLQRIIFSKMNYEEKNIEFHWSANIDLLFYPVLDRAHFPTEPIVV